MDLSRMTDDMLEQYPCQSRREVNPGDDGVAISRVVETAASWDGAPLPSYPRGAPRVTILRATVPPHTALAMHTHALVNAGVILRGELTVIAETVPNDVPPR